MTDRGASSLHANALPNHVISVCSTRLSGKERRSRVGEHFSLVDCNLRIAAGSSELVPCF